MSEDVHSATSRAAYCPSCERFIGPAGTCPYCDADSAQPRAIRWLKWCALAFGIVGVAALLLTARWREIPGVKPGDVTRTMQFARVKMTGAAERKAFVGEKEGQVDYLAFTLADGTQSVRVVAYGKVALEIVRAGQTPRDDDRVTAEGSLVTGRDGKMRLRIDEAKGISIAGR